jgi:proline iminopeptidase
VAVYYALQCPERVTKVIGIAGCGVHKDRTRSEAYHANKHTEPDIPIDWNPPVHAALQASYVEWMHEPQVLRQLADCRVPMTLIAAELDVRPSWPLEQLAALLPSGTFTRVAGVPHDFWATHPDVWVRVVTEHVGD